ncbi:MAG: shikimate dehydrogenase [Candidatus Lokiarchaeota archaeon]|nr:shikimate dehydrogenase [Candidatus Lokiarchaeota archaeon]
MVNEMVDINLSGKTKMVILIGNPVEHSMSPKMHTMAFKEIKMDAVYLATKVENDKVKEAIDSIKALNLLGANVTVPHKVAVMNHIDEIDPIARDIGAVNTIINENGKLYATNTDGLGFIRSMKDAGIKLKDIKAVMIGAGGVARAIAFYLLQEIDSLKLTDIKNEVSKELLLKLKERYGDRVEKFDLTIENLEKELKNANLLINCTPVGMHPNVNKTPIPKEFLRKDLVVFDAVYNPLETLLLKNAKAVGAIVISGVKMFVYQGVEAFERWTKKKAPVELMEKIVLDSLK